MKIICTILLCTVGILLGEGCRKSGEPFSGPPNTMKRYPYERLHLTYEYSGDVRGTEELFVADYGRKEARYSKFEVLSEHGVRPEENGGIMRFADTYTIDFSEKRINHQRVRYLDSLYHLDAEDTPSPQGYMDNEMKKNYFTNTGIDTIAGKPAKRWQQVDGGMSLWVWNSLLLRKRSSSPEGSLDMIIKNIDSLWIVDTMKFSIPSGFPITEGARMNNAPAAN